MGLSVVQKGDMDFSCDLRLHVKLQNPKTTPYGRKVDEMEEGRKENSVNTRTVHSLRFLQISSCWVFIRCYAKI